MSNTFGVYGFNSNKTLNSALIETGAGYIGYGLGYRFTPALQSIESNTAQGVARFMIQKNYSLTDKGLNLRLQNEYGQ